MTAVVVAADPRSRLATVGIFSVSVGMMALKPVLLHQTRSSGSGGGGSGDEGGAMLPAHFQMAAECFKVAICAVVLGTRWTLGLSAPVWRGWSHTAVFAIPAAIYLLMNVLTVRAARLLPPPTFQLLANMKILWTGVAAWAVLGRRISSKQWLAMLLLTAGVTLGQWRNADELNASALGSALMMVTSFLSGLGGVSTEKLLKDKRSADLSIFAMNLHMALHSLLQNSAALLAAPSEGGELLPRASSLRKIDLLTLANEAVNGILISLLMRRLDSIVKNYAFSASVFATAAFSALILGYTPPLQLYVGAAATVASMALHARGAAGGATAAPKKES